ncbi:dihydrofolate reductase family protein [Trujillonella endophytica]|uniref:Dihydrofolate reductase n=1 Tax=Trujillonella endophytica TaxID=673521 RepID=A0A1H8PTH5_9ACTN|nr:dihydrofolate reductase family protein [Trujillella endophytica]SEO45225.1 Dihydrofolate reductase [Trujillella endophytica]
MTRTVYYTATTLDGFIATPEHSLDWLLSRQIDQDGPFGYKDFEKRIGAVVMGASTYRWIRRHEPDSWAYAIPTWVLTHSRDLEPFPGADIRITAADSPEALTTLHGELVAAAGGRDVWVVGGGDLAGQFAEAGLLDELVVSIAPVTIGAGAPLLPRHVELVRTEWAVNGEFVCVRYDVVR